MPTFHAMKLLLRIAVFGLVAMLCACESDAPSPILGTDPGTLLSITVEPDDPTVEVNATLQLRALGHYEDGSVRDLSHEASWSSADPLVATVDDSSSKGLVTGRCCGKLSILVVLGTVPGRVLVTVESTSRVPSLLSLSPTNGRYFVDASGEHVLLTGSHTWLTLQDVGSTNPPPAFDYAAYLDSLETWNHNFFRLWMSEHGRWALNLDRDDLWTAPLPYVRTGPGTALDGSPQFDLDQWDETYFARMRERSVAAATRGFYVAVMLFQGWSVVKEKLGTAERNPWLAHPYHRDNNINGVDGDLNDDDSGGEIQELLIPEITALQESYVHKVIDTIGDLPNVIFEISNESEGNATEWQEHMVQVIRDYEATRPLQHMVGITVEWPGGTNEELFAGPADWIAPASDFDDPEPADGSKVIVADTDHICGICGSQEWVWKSFTRGHNPVFMDLYDNLANIIDPGDPLDPSWFEVRYSMGFIRTVASRLDLGVTIPHPELSSTGYCLAKTAAPEATYVVYSPGNGGFDVDLSTSTGSFSVEWMHPDTGEFILDGEVEAGSLQTLDPPFIGDAVVILQEVQP